MHIKLKHKNKDYECVLGLGLIIGVFLLPLANSVFYGTSAALANIALICGMPLICLVAFYLNQLLFPKNKTWLQFVRFALIGVANTAVNIGVFNYFVNLTGITYGWPILVISSVACLAAIVNSYIWNSHWAFEEGFTNTIYQFERFFLVTFLGLIVNISMVILVTTLLHRFEPERLAVNLANLVGVIFAMFVNFVGYRHLVFKKKKI